MKKLSFYFLIIFCLLTPALASDVSVTSLSDAIQESTALTKLFYLIVVTPFLAMFFYLMGSAIKSRDILVAFLWSLFGLLLLFPFLLPAYLPQTIGRNPDEGINALGDMRWTAYTFNVLAILFFKIGLNPHGLKKGFVADFWAGLIGGIVGCFIGIVTSKLSQPFFSPLVVGFGSAFISVIAGILLSRILDRWMGNFVTPVVASFTGALVGGIILGLGFSFISMLIFGSLTLQPGMAKLGLFCGLGFGGYWGARIGSRIGKQGYGKGGGGGFGGAALSLGSFAKSFRWGGGFSGGAGAAGSW